MCISATKTIIMKKSVPILLFLFSANILLSQSRSGGFRGGINLAQWKLTVTYQGASASQTSDTKTGFLIGLFQTYMFNKNVGIQPEIFYNSNGSILNGATFTTNYVSVPVFFRYNMSDQFHLLGGPQLSILASADCSVPGAGSGSIKEYVNSTDFGLVFGLGGDFGRFNLGVRYNLGLTGVFNSSFNNLAFGNSGIDAKFTNVGWQIVCGAKAFGN